MLLTNFQNQPMESSRRDRDTHTQQGAEIQSNKFRNIGLSMLFKVIKITVQCIISLKENNPSTRTLEW